MEEYADVIIDISHERLDRPFQYRIPEDLRGAVSVGVEVAIPFGSGDKERKGYVVGISARPQIEESRIKDVLRVNTRSVSMEGKLLSLAAWMHRRYGGTMITAMRTVLPVKKRVREASYKTVVRTVDADALRVQIRALNPARYAARIRLYEALLCADALPYGMLTGKLGVSSSVVSTAQKQGYVRVDTDRVYRNPVPAAATRGEAAMLTEEQQAVADAIIARMHGPAPTPALLRGITGSGKTEVYMELIADAISRGRQAIVLIPEIALTFQTLMRFYARFGERVSLLHSRLSDGERYEQYERARRGELDIIIGPRSALFAPFPSLGIVVIDEEHESSYKSEKMPKYHAREVAEYLCAREGAQLVLGSATPSLGAYYKAQTGAYQLYTLNARYGGARLPRVHIVDLRTEMRSGNRTMFSAKLRELLTERIYRGEQSMLFLNRRGIAGSVVCRSCGYVAKCPHCDVSLTEHRDGRLYCHYCGHSEVKPQLCPQCGSQYIAGFRAGTERVEEEIRNAYPSARVLRMDADTTKRKDDYERILSGFANGEADILVGTQMIVKGHDFPNVTLVGALNADMSLGANDYNATERTFQLLAQAAGRAGRGRKPGEVVIQTYQPEHYSIVQAAAQDYEAFYAQEIGYRELMGYPPVAPILAVQLYAPKEVAGMAHAQEIAQALRERYGGEGLTVLGPAAATIGRVKDVYRFVIYVKHAQEETLVAAKDLVEALHEERQASRGAEDVSIQYDFNPVSGF